MKKVVLSSLAVLGLAVGAFGQGAIVVDNTGNATGYLNLGAANYSGPFGLEVWWKAGSAGDTAINSLNGVNAASAYALLTANGFALATHIDPGHAGTTANGGLVTGLGEVDIPTLTPAGGTAVFALAFWQGNGNSFLGAQNAGIYSFANPTGNYQASPPNPPSPTDNWDQSVSMSPVPEPGTFALAGLGAAALLIFRRRK